MKSSLFLLLLAGLLFRIVIIPTYFNADVITQAEWSQSLEIQGTKGFYDRVTGFMERPNHPPLVSIWYFLVPEIQGFISLVLTNIGLFIASHRLGASHILWFYDFVKWFGSDVFHTNEQTSIRYGFMMTMKLLPIVADLLIGGLIYKFANYFNPKKALFYTGLYLLFPFSLYVSAYWGQSDPVAALFLFIAFLSLYKKRFIISPVLLIVSLLIKPTGVLLVPLFIFYYLYSRTSIRALLISVFSSLLVYFVTLYIFTNNNLILYSQKLIQTLFFTKIPVLSASAFNLWFIVGGFSKTPDTITFLFLPAKLWGLLIAIALNLFAISLIRRKNIKAFLGALFIAGFGSWVFLTNMYERYLFNGILALFFLSIVDRKYLKYFFILSFISLLNMLQGPLAPYQVLDFLRLDNMIFSKILAAINIVIFLKISYSLLKTYNYKKICNLS